MGHNFCPCIIITLIYISWANSGFQSFFLIQNLFRTLGERISYAKVEILDGVAATIFSDIADAQIKVASKKTDAGYMALRVIAKNVL